MLSTILCLAACTLSVADGETNDADALAPQVARLIVQLDAPEKVRRDEAEQQLSKLGTGALSHLHDPDTASAEVKLRLGRVRTQLEKLRAEEEVGASKVTFAGEALPLAEAIKAFEQQTQNKLIDYREQFGQQPEEKELKLTFNNVDFWPALDQMLDEAELSLYPFANESCLAIINRPMSQRPRYKQAEYAGAFRIEPTEIIARRFPRDRDAQSLSLQLEVAWEPRLKPMALTYSTEGVVATDDQGKPIEVAQETQSENLVNPNDVSTQLSIRFVPPSRDVRKIASLQGTFKVLLPGAVESFRFEKLSLNAKADQQRGGVRVLLERVRKNNLVWEVRVRIVFENAGQALESHRTWVLQNEAFLENGKGERIEYAGMESTRHSDSEIGLAYLFDVDDIAEHTFVYKTPVSVMNPEVKYRLTDIELP